MKRKQKEVEINQSNEEESKDLEYAKITFSFCLTKDEADKILHDKKSSVARKARQYMYAILKEAASRFFPEENNVKNCKDSEEKA